VCTAAGGVCPGAHLFIIVMNIGTSARKILRAKPGSMPVSRAPAMGMELTKLRGGRGWGV
jgi:hypothetical protein